MSPLRRAISLIITAALLLSLLVLPAASVEDDEDPGPGAHAAEEDEPPAETAVQPVREETSPSEPVPSPGTPVQTPALIKDHPVYIQGFPDGTFRPESSLTRAQAVQMVDRLLADPDGGKGPCSFIDVPSGQWYTQAIRDVTSWGLVDNGDRFRPDDLMSRGDFAALLVRLHPEAQGTASFPDVPSSDPNRAAIGAAAALGWVTGFPDGSFHPNRGLTRAEAVTMLNRAAARPGDSDEAGKLLSLGLFPDVGPKHWAGTAILEAAVAHAPRGSETWTGVDYSAMTFDPGFHDWNGKLFYAGRQGELAVNTTLGVYTAGADGALSWTSQSYVTPDVPYMSQIDDIYAWVGCEAVAALPGLRVKGFAGDITLRKFLDDLPRSRSDPEKGFVGSPYVPDKSKRTRTTIYPAKLAEYCNSYCGGEVPCADFRGASVTDLQRELLGGNLVVGYLTLWWARPQYRQYNIEGRIQTLVSNNHAILVCGYDPDKGYFVSDPYNYYNRGQVYQYWVNKSTFESIWNERKVGMVIR